MTLARDTAGGRDEETDSSAPKANVKIGVRTVGSIPHMYRRGCGGIIKDEGLLIIDKCWGEVYNCRRKRRLGGKK